MANSHISENKSGHVDGMKSRPKSELGNQTFDLGRDALDKLLGPISDEWKTKVVVPPRGEIGGIWANEANFLQWANECAEASTEAPLYCKITATTVIPSPDGSTRRKPDLAILRPLGPLATHLRNNSLAPSERRKLLGNVSWKEVHITGEFSKQREKASATEEPLNSNLKSSNESLNSGDSGSDPPEAIDYLSEAAYHLLRSQPDRQHTIHFTVNNAKLRLSLFNRSGRFELGPFDLDKDPYTCQWVFHRLPRLTLADLGFIEMLAPLADFGRELKWGSFIGNVKEELYTTRSIASRTTATYRVEGTYAGAPFNGVVKFAWVDMHREFTELEALDIIREKGTHVALVRPPSAPSSPSDALSSQLPSFLTTSFIGKDETLRLWLEKHPEFVPRKLSVVFLSPVAKPIQHYGSVQHLLRAFIDAVEAHQWLCETAKILHRDISMANIMLQADNRAEGTKGLLIDLDLSVRCEQNERSPANHRTGTFPFIAVDLLRDETCEHLPRHDLESFFYVLVWICTFYGPPTPVSDATSEFDVCEKPAPQLDKADAIILEWQTSSAIRSKEALLGPRSLSDIVKQLDPFWKPLVEAGVFDGLRELFIPIWNVRDGCDVTHEDFLRVLNAGLVKPTKSQATSK